MTPWVAMATRAEDLWSSEGYDQPRQGRTTMADAHRSVCTGTWSTWTLQWSVPSQLEPRSSTALRTCSGVTGTHASRTRRSPVVACHPGARPRRCCNRGGRSRVR